MVESGNMAVAQAQHGRPIEQRLRLDLPSVPQHVKPLGEIGLRKTRIEFQRYVERCQRLVVLMGQAQSASERAVAETVELVERHRMVPLAQRRFQPRRAIFRFVNERALQVDIAERAVAARGRSRTRQIGTLIPLLLIQHEAPPLSGGSRYKTKQKQTLPEEKQRSCQGIRQAGTGSLIYRPVNHRSIRG